MQEKPDDDLIDALQSLTRDLTGLALRSLQNGASDLGLTQIRMMFAVRDNEHGTCAELATMLGISPSSVTRQADRLVGSGHLTRREDPNNRRVVLLELTELGHNTLGQVLDRRAEVFARISADLKPTPHRQLTASLRKLHEALTREPTVN